jgi:hypothetical protein
LCVEGINELLIFFGKYFDLKNLCRTELPEENVVVEGIVQEVAPECEVDDDAEEKSSRTEEQ